MAAFGVPERERGHPEDRQGALQPPWAVQLNAVSPRSHERQRVSSAFAELAPRSSPSPWKPLFSALLDEAAVMCHVLVAFNGPKDRGRSQLPARLQDGNRPEINRMPPWNAIA